MYKPFLVVLHQLTCPAQLWYLPPCPTNPDFLSHQLSEHHLGDVRIRLFCMLFVMLVLLWPMRTMSAAVLNKGMPNSADIASNSPPSCDVGIHSNLPTLVRTSSFPNHRPRWYSRHSTQEPLARRESSETDLPVFISH
jgi:hypothetical protein